MRIIPCLLALLTMAACASGPKALPKPDGQVFRLNQDRWEETVNDIPRLQRATEVRQ